MKQSRIIGIVLTVVNMILIVICAVFYFKADKTAPKFVFQAADIIYEEGMDAEALITGITAYDSDDGDVTDRIVIEKMIENRQEGTLIVFYAVSDKSGNVAKTSKMFQALWNEGNKKAGDDKAQEVTADQLMEAGIQADLRDEDAAVLSGSGQEDSGPLPMVSPAPEPLPSPTATPSPTAKPSPAATPVPVQEPQQSETQQEERRQEERQQAAAENSEAPVLILNASEVKTPVGSAPAWVNVISTLKDDKDSYETLFHNLSVSKYDVNKAGTYQVTVYTEDSDGNQSKAVPLTIIVG